MNPHQHLRWKFPDHMSQGMVVVDLAIAVCEKEQSARSSDSSPQILDHIQRCLVRPLRVLDHEDRRAHAS